MHEGTSRRRRESRIAMMPPVEVPFKYVKIDGMGNRIGETAYRQ